MRKITLKTGRKASLIGVERGKYLFRTEAYKGPAGDWDLSIPKQNISLWIGEDEMENNRCELCEDLATNDYFGIAVCDEHLPIAISTVADRRY